MSCVLERKLVLLGGRWERSVTLGGMSLACLYVTGWESLSCLSHQPVEEDDGRDVPGFHVFRGGCSGAGGN